MSVEGFEVLRRPSRPALTPLFVCAMSFWGLCACGYAGGGARESTFSLVLAAAGFLVGVAAVPLIMKRRLRTLALVIAAAAIGFSLGCVQAAQIIQFGAQVEGFSGMVELTALEDGTNNGYGENVLVEAYFETGMTGTFTARCGDVGPMLAGERFYGFAKFEKVDYESDAFAWSEGSHGILKMSSLEPRNAPFPFDVLLAMRKEAIGSIGESDDGHKLLQALVCGYRRNVTGTELYSQFQTCGLAHLVAVSGAHLIIVTGMFASLMRFLRASRQLTVPVLIAVMVAYYVISGMPVSALRAVIMSTLGMLAFMGRRRSSSLNAVGVGVIGLTVAHPATCISAAFVLSVLSTAGIVLFSPLFKSWFEELPALRLPLVADSMSLTLAANILSQLYSCSLFAQLPIISPLANMLAAPFFPIACGTGLVYSLVSQVPGIADVLEGLAVLSSGVLAGAVAMLSRIPFASIPFSIETAEALVVSIATALALWATWPKEVRKAIAFCCPVLMAFLLTSYIYFDRSDAIIALDVGQGDSILVQSRGRYMLIDTGNQDSRLLEQLGRNHITHLDVVLITHADDDHCGSIDALRKAVEVDRIVIAEEMIECDGEAARSLVSRASSSAHEICGVGEGDVFQIGAFSAKVIWPDSFTEEGGNADSLCLRLDYDGDDDGTVDHVALMTGDAEKNELSQMIDAGRVGDVDILKVGHHGSRNGSTEAEMRVLRPEIALISCGAKNRYGHPTQEILGQLSSIGASTFRTDEDGEIRCVLTTERISVSCVD